MNIKETVKHKIKWTYKGYYISSKSIVFNRDEVKVKQCSKNGNIGYYIDGKFTTITYIKNNLKLYRKEKDFCPF